MSVSGLTGASASSVSRCEPRAGVWTGFVRFWNGTPPPPPAWRNLGALCLALCMLRRCQELY